MSIGRNAASALERAVWLAELDVAINEAQALAWRLGVAEGDSREAKLLYARLETLRSELAALRRGSWSPAAHDFPGRIFNAD